MPTGGMMRQIVGELAQSKTKGKDFVDELNAKMSPSGVSKTPIKTQTCKGFYKK